jgi:hypothetical protein
MSKTLASSELFDLLHRAGMFTDDPTMVRRVIIGLEHGKIAKCYVERFVDPEVLEIAFGTPGLRIVGAE